MESLSAGWSSIRPWIPPLSLLVREITSVSVTFVLSAASLSLGTDLDRSLAVLGISSETEAETEDLHDDDDGADDEDSTSESDAKKPTSRSVVSTALSGGLSVQVDRSSWRRVFIRIDDKADEAVIIVYGLMPGRQYEIVLELVQGGQTNSISQQVQTTDENETKESGKPDTVTLDNGTSTIPNTRPNTPPAAPPRFAPLTLSDHIAQLQHTLSLLTAEQSSLTATLKSSRRDAQKADAHLRSEIDILKKSSERFVSSEQRSKQKVLALQEAVKRAQLLTRDLEEKVLVVTNDEVPVLNEEKCKRESEYRQIKDAATKVRLEKEEEAERERKRIEGMKGELGPLVKQLEKLDTKKEKLEGTVIKELEEHLADVEKELEELEREEEMGVATARPNPNWNSAVLDATIGRSSSLIRPRAIAHPVSLPHPSPNSQWTPITPPRQPPTHMNKRSTSVPQPSLQHGTAPLTHPHHQHHVTTRPPTTILTNPNRQAAKTTLVREPSVEHLSLSNTTPSTSGLMFGSPGLASNTISASTSNTSGGGSTLSSRAPPFEPQAGLARGVGSIGGRSRSRISGP